METTSRYDDFLKLVKDRRTVRRFKPDPVPDDYITKVIDAARWAPSGFHTQPWEFVIVKEKDVKDRIVKVLNRKGPAIQDPDKEKQERRSFRDAPVYIFLLCDYRAMVGLPGNPREVNSQVETLLCSSSANAFLYMHLAATSLGLASQWYTATSRAEVERSIREIIGIPDYLKIYDMMVLGYPDESPGPKIVRNLDEMMHFDACGADDFRTDAEVEAYAKETNAWCLSEH